MNMDISIMNNDNTKVILYSNKYASNFEYGNEISVTRLKVSVASNINISRHSQSMKP